MTVAMRNSLAGSLRLRVFHLAFAGLLALSVFGVSLFVGSSNGASAASATTATTTVYLNFRTGPSLNYRIMAVMPPGSTVTVTGNATNGFYPVVYNGTQGWAYGSYLQFSTSANSTANTSRMSVQSSSSVPAGIGGGSGGTVTSIIYAAAARYGQSGDAMMRVARCESGLNPSAVNRSSGASGLFQFMPSTWRTTPYAGSSIFDPYANANAAAWMWSVGRKGEWTCQ